MTSAMDVGCFCASSCTTGFAPVSFQGTGGAFMSGDIAAKADAANPSVAIQPAANAAAAGRAMVFLQMCAAATARQAGSFGRAGSCS